MASVPEDLYAVLGIAKSAKDTEVRRAYRKLLTTAHPDKGGDAEKFAAIQQAYDVLSVASKRSAYDRTGQIIRSADEELMETFGGGKFRDKMRAAEEERDTLNEAIAVRQSEEAQSHSAGFDTWLRTRTEMKVFTGDDVAEEFGVNKSSYEAVELPKIKAYQVRCNALGVPDESVEVCTEAIPKELEWGEILVNPIAMPINPADIYSIKMGAAPYSAEADTLKPPFVCGNDCVATVVKIGPGVKNVREDDWVLPYKPGMGTWRALAVWREKDVIKLPKDIMPVPFAAMTREMCVAYRLLEDYGSLKPGDSVILNAANSVVGTCVIQLCRMLKLRTIAVVRDPEDPRRLEELVQRLKSLGAAEVLLDGGSIKAKLDEHKFFSKPRLALDAVGGASAVALADALQDGCPLIIYGCMSGKPPVFPWAQWVFKDLQVRGFNLRKWISNNRKKLPAMIETLSKLVMADKIKLEYLEYELSTEFSEALEHAEEAGRNVKVLLKVNDVGITY